MTTEPTLQSSLVVLDTKVISELMRAAPDERVQAWARSLPATAAHTTSITLAKVRFGIARLPAGRRKDLLTEAAGEVFDTFADRVLPFDAAAANHYGDVVVERDQAGTSIAGFDAQIAAICRSRHAVLATRNRDDFTRLGLELINPWD